MARVAKEQVEVTRPERAYSVKSSGGSGHGCGSGERRILKTMTLFEIGFLAALAACCRVEAENMSAGKRNGTSCNRSPREAKRIRIMAVHSFKGRQ